MMRTNYSLDQVTDLDIETFNALAETIIRLESHDKIERAWMHMVAAQGRPQDMTRMTQSWERMGRGEDPTTGTMADFLRDMGRGA